MADSPALRLDDFDTPSSISSDRAVLLARLDEAARAQTTLHCVYFGGPKGGVEHHIVPLKIDPPDVWALCTASGRRKRFRLGLLYILAPGEDPRWARPLEERSVAPKLSTRIDTRNIRTRSQLIEAHGEALDALGWRIVLSDRGITLQRITDEDGEAVVALRQLSNGHWAVESLDRRRIARRRLGAAAKIFLDAAGRNARPQTAAARRPVKHSSFWTLLGFMGAAVLALGLGLTIGVLLPH